MLMPMVYMMTSSIGAHIYTLHYAHAHGIHDEELDRGAYIYTLHHAHADGKHDGEFDRGAYIHTTPCSCRWYTRWRIGKGRIHIHYTMLTPMVYTMTSWIGAHIYAHAYGIHDDEFHSCAYISRPLPKKARKKTRAIFELPLSWA